MLARIRLAEQRDAEAIAAIYRPFVEVTAISFEVTPPDRAEIARRVEETGRTHPWLVCDVDDHVVAYAYASAHRTRSAYQWSVDTSVYVDPRYQRRGIGRGLYTSLFGILAAHGFRNAFAGIALPNPASVRLHESLGFTAIGVYDHVGYKLGAWHSVGWWQLTLLALGAHPAPPIDSATVRALPQWASLLAAGESLISGGLPGKSVARVIFACVHNAGRSQMAAAFFRQLADPTQAQAISAGTNPGNRVHPVVVDVMREAGIDISENQPQRLTDDVARQAALLITMGCGDECPYVPGLQRDDWPLPDPKDQPIEQVRAIRDEIRLRISELVNARGWATSAPSSPG